MSKKVLVMSIAAAALVVPALSFASANALPSSDTVPPSAQQQPPRPPAFDKPDAKTLQQMQEHEAARDEVLSKELGIDIERFNQARQLRIDVHEKIEALSPDQRQDLFNKLKMHSPKGPGMHEPGMRGPGMPGPGMHDTGMHGPDPHSPTEPAGPVPPSEPGVQ